MSKMTTRFSLSQATVTISMCSHVNDFYAKKPARFNRGVRSNRTRCEQDPVYVTFNNL